MNNTISLLYPNIQSGLLSGKKLMVDLVSADYVDVTNIPGLVYNHSIVYTTQHDLTLKVYDEDLSDLQDGKLTFWNQSYNDHTLPSSFHIIKTSLSRAICIEVIHGTEFSFQSEGTE